MSNSQKFLNLKLLFKNVTDSLIQQKDETWIFKNGKKSIHSGFFYNGPESDIPTIEEIFQYFDKEILSKIPHSMLLIRGRLSIEVNIDENNYQIKKIQRAKRELDIYKSIKTLFFPTLNEYLVKFGKSKSEWIYFTEKEYKIINTTIDGKLLEDEEFIIYAKKGMAIHRFIQDTAIDFLSEEIRDALGNFSFQNPI